MRATSTGHAGILVTTRQGVTIACDPWFLPAFFGSWFVFPRNDRLAADVMATIDRPDFLYISHLHADHLDELFLADHISRDTTVLLPGYPSGELRRTLERFGFHRFIQTEHATAIEIAPGVSVEIHIETSISDGPGGDSSLIVDDGETRLLDQNDCRIHDLAALIEHGPIDQHWLQFSGAIWYPMVYEMPAEEMTRSVKAKVEAQFARAISYVQAVGARAVVPCAGPPCFLDPDLFGFNIIDGDEPSIFPDALEFERRLQAAGITACTVVIPGSAVVTSATGVEVVHAVPLAEVMRPFHQKRAYLEEYQADWMPWLDAMKAAWPAPTPDVVDTVRNWWEPLLDRCPMLRTKVGACALFRSGDAEFVVDFPMGEVRPYAGEPYRFRFDIPRPLLETVVAARAVDWSNALFLSCRFRAWRDGDFNEYLYNFLKSLSVERIDRTEAEAESKAAARGEAEEITLGGYVVERYCPHRRADLTRFGSVEGCTLTCALHGWQFDLDSGKCLTADDRSIRARPA